MDNDKQFGDFLSKLRMKSGFKSQRQLAIEANISPATLSRIEAGTQKPQPETLLAISKFLKDATYEDLMKAAGYLNENPNSAEHEIFDFMQSYFNESERIRESPKEYAQNLINKIMSKVPNKDEENEFVHIPILGTIKAGYDLYAEQNIEGYSLMLKSEVSDGEYFYLKVKGDSMSGDRIYEGDRVLVRRQDFVEDNDIAVVLINGDEATLKRVTPLGNDLVALLASNPTYPMKTYPIDQVQIQGIVTKVEFDIK